MLPPKKIPEIAKICEGLNDSPTILQDMLQEIPEAMYRQRRIGNKWSIHEHICHLADAEAMIYQRFRQIANLVPTTFRAYLPNKNVDTNHFQSLQTTTQFQIFKRGRKKLLTLITDFGSQAWNLDISHEEYQVYSPYILLRHTLMHDYFHMYRIEELWLTRDKFLS